MMMSPSAVNLNTQPQGDFVTTIVTHQDGRREVIREIDLRSKRDSMASVYSQTQNNQHVQYSPNLSQNSPIFTNDVIPLAKFRTNSNHMPPPESLYPQRNQPSQNPPQRNMYTNPAGAVPYMTQPISQAVKSSLYLDEQYQQKERQYQKQDHKGYVYGYHETEAMPEKSIAQTAVYPDPDHYQLQRQPPLQSQSQQLARSTSNTSSLHLDSLFISDEKIAAPASDPEPVNLNLVSNPNSVPATSQISTRKPSKRPVNQPTVPPKVPGTYPDTVVQMGDKRDRRAKLLEVLREVNQC